MTDPTQAYPVYTSGILMATFSLLTIFLIMPPLFWHFQHRNIGATALIIWLMILLFFNFVNALLWPSDNLATWWNGVGLCDIETKIQVAAQVGIPSSFACILRALAAVLDTDSATLSKTRSQRRRECALDLLWCVGLPLLEMPLQFIVQPHRYGIFGISGCAFMVDDSWLTMVSIIIPPAIWVLVDAYFATLIIIRLYRYRLAFRSILANRNTTRSRFIRLYLLCITWILFSVPFEALVLYKNANRSWHAYSWSETHSAERWNEIVLIPSDGQISFGHWISLGIGLGVFVFFALGKEAVNMYRLALVKAGLGQVFPSLKKEYVASTSTSSLISRKARSFFKWKQMTSTSISSSGPAVSPTFTATDVSSTPEKEAFGDRLASVDTG